VWSRRTAPPSALVGLLHLYVVLYVGFASIFAFLYNYGFRHLLATGLHPGLPLHHANDQNGMRLVDDLMEPFRPLVDAQVRQLADLGLYDVTSATKRELALLMSRSIPTPEGLSPIANAIERLCLSLAQVYEGGRNKLSLPLPKADGVRAMLGEKAALAVNDDAEAEEVPAADEDRCTSSARQ
jgi:CRISPR-associated protein Cas1